MDRGRKIVSLVAKDKYDEAIALIREELKERKSLDKHLEGEDRFDHFDNHWLYGCLSTCYYEKRQYKKALQYSGKAIQMAPKCPISLWYHASGLDMVGRTHEAIEMYRGILKRGVRGIAYGICGEGVKWSEAMLNDCRYRLGLCNRDLAKQAGSPLDKVIYIQESRRWLKLHLRMRTKGQKSIYSKKEVERKLREIDDAANREADRASC